MKRFNCGLPPEQQEVLSSSFGPQHDDFVSVLGEQQELSSALGVQQELSSAFGVQQELFSVLGVQHDVSTFGSSDEQQHDLFSLILLFLILFVHY